ncbi:hypothetical protein EYF80_011125 [Liparis tanakae]|uniref:Uncharacterized protein n=1 Tax=Liparis tanakae TaxID=230148 RepID=A0A4Z2ILQ4_9TELE|nr:hypothetical protein EYF80_011125 [Liparis tanakae]
MGNRVETKPAPSGQNDLGDLHCELYPQDKVLEEEGELEDQSSRITCPLLFSGAEVAGVDGVEEREATDALSPPGLAAGGTPSGALAPAGPTGDAPAAAAAAAAVAAAAAAALLAVMADTGLGCA